MMKAVRAATKEYWMVGIEKRWEIQIKRMRQAGEAIIRPSFENVILGSPLNYLY
jgi:hypothetical protein